LKIQELSNVGKSPINLGLDRAPGDWLYLVLRGEVPPFLDGKFVCPSDKQPISESNTIADDLIERAIRSRVLGNRKPEIKLADEAILTLENKLVELLSPTESRKIIVDILFMAEYFPVSEPDKAVEVLFNLVKKEELRKWPSLHEDAHRMSINALASKLEYAKNIPEGLTEDLVCELANSDYCVSAFRALMKVSPELAIEKLPEVVKVLETEPASSLLLIECLSKELRKQEHLITQVANTLRKFNLTEVTIKIAQELKKNCANETALKLVNESGATQLL